MQRSSKLKRESKVQSYSPLADVEHVANLMMLEAQTSMAKAGRVMGKLIAMSGMGFLLASNCCMSRYLVPVGTFILAISAGWLDTLGNECRRHRFFPYKSLNYMGVCFFRWQWVVVWTCTIYAVSLTGLVQSLQFSFEDKLWKVAVMAVLPLVLMLLGRAVEMFQFRHVRSQVEKSEYVVRQLAATCAAADITAMAPLIEAEHIPLYRLGSIAKLLYDFVIMHDATDKHSIDLTQGLSKYGGPFQETISMVYNPFRRVASDLLLWESRDLVIYIVTAIYVVLVYFGSFHLPWSPLTPFCILLPFFAPKSRAARYARALQENIRLAQLKESGASFPAEQTASQDNSMPIVNWPMVIYLISSHCTALYAAVVLILFGGSCPLFGKGAAVRFETLVLAVVMYIVAGLGITAGAHRLWAHRSYKASTPLRLVLMIFNSIANQGSIFHWARDHRVHHLHSDTVADPHNANRGFWFSHVGWLLVKKNKAVIEAGKKVNMNDLSHDPIVMFQKRADPFWNLSWCFAFPAFTALGLGDSLWNGFLYAGILRYVLSLNATWAVNSVVHAWGNRPYNPSHLTTENGWVSLVALGEGWHNWHHAFAWDYAAAELGPLLQFNPTKIFIDAMALIGLAWDRKRADKVWQARKARWEEFNGRPVVESLEGPPMFKHRVVTFGPVPYDEDSEVQTLGEIEQTTTERIVQEMQGVLPQGQHFFEARACDDAGLSGVSRCG